MLCPSSSTWRADRPRRHCRHRHGRLHAPAHLSQGRRRSRPSTGPHQSRMRRHSRRRRRVRRPFLIIFYEIYLTFFCFVVMLLLPRRRSMHLKLRLCTRCRSFWRLKATMRVSMSCCTRSRTRWRVSPIWSWSAVGRGRFWRCRIVCRTRCSWRAISADSRTCRCVMILWRILVYLVVFCGVVCCIL